MSVASDITALATKLSTIFDQCKTALAAKGVSGAPADLAAVPAKITAIVTGTGIDTSDATATAGDIRSGKTAYADGTKLTGTLVPGIDTSDANAAASDILSGKTAYVNGTKVTGNITTVTKAKPTISVNTSTGKINASYTQSAGTVTAGTVSADEVSLTTKSAATIYPTSVDKTIAAGTFLTGKQTIPGDTNFKASNIKSGVTLWGLTGSYSGGGSITLASENIYVSNTRTGARAIAFSGFTVPSGYKLIGVAAANNSEPDANYQLQTFAVFTSECGGLGFCTNYSNAGAMTLTSVLSLTVSGGSGTVTITSSEGYTFAPGSYNFKPIFAPA